MQEYKLIEETGLNLLANPIQGRAYLKAALNQGDEQIFLQTLHEIMDSLLSSEDGEYGLSSFPTWENAKVA